MSPQNNSLREYVSRINRVTDFIEGHLEEEINLGKMAQIACFSPFHFHRIFATISGETINGFVQRKRVEKAARLLKNQPELSIGEIAFNCGFASGSHFSRTFRKHSGLSAKEFRDTDSAVFAVNGIYFSKNGQVVRKIHQENKIHKDQICSDSLIHFNHSDFILMNTQIEVKEMPELNVIYCRHTGQFNQIEKAYKKLMTWAGPRGLLNFPQTKTLTVYHDDPTVTAIEQVRQSACITVDKEVKVEGEIGKMKVESGRYAVGRFEIGVMDFEKAWNTMCLWFTESGYQPAEGHPYELYYNSPEQDKQGKFVLDICIPVKSL